MRVSQWSIVVQRNVHATPRDTTPRCAALLSLTSTFHACQRAVRYLPASHFRTAHGLYVPASVPSISRQSSVASHSSYQLTYWRQLQNFCRKRQAEFISQVTCQLVHCILGLHVQQIAVYNINVTNIPYMAGSFKMSDKFISGYSSSALHWCPFHALANLRSD